METPIPISSLAKGLGQKLERASKAKFFPLIVVRGLTCLVWLLFGTAGTLGAGLDQPAPHDDNVMLICERSDAARQAQQMAHQTWREICPAFVTWIEAKGDKSPLLTARFWKISVFKLNSVWSISSDHIYMLGGVPSWMPFAGPLDELAPPPFLRRPLAPSEVKALSSLVTRVLEIDSFGPTVAGISAAMRNSVLFSDGSGTKCMANFVTGGGVYVSDRFPDPADAPESATHKLYKIIEIKDVATKHPAPSCELVDLDSDGFFAGADEYYSRIEFEPVVTKFVRPDGTFWLWLSDNNFYRFRRDMTSDAPEIGSKYYVLPEEDFQSIIRNAKNIENLDAAIFDYLNFRGRRH